MDCRGCNYLAESKRFSFQRFWWGAIIAACIAGAPAAGWCQAYLITDLGYPNDSYCEAHGINATGNVVGEYELTNSATVSAFLYQNGSRTDLGYLSGPPYAAAFSVNASNYIVGESDYGNSTHGFEWANGVLKDLGALNGSGYSSAHAINRDAQIVGESSTSFLFNSPIHAVLWSGSTMTDLGALDGSYSSAYSINSSGVMVGETDVLPAGSSNVVTHAFVYSNNSMQDIGTLPGANDYSAAFGINDSGVIVGESDTVVAGVSTTHAFIYSNGTMTDLGTFGGTLSSASAINSAGHVVGYANDANQNSRAFLYYGSGLIDLNNLIAPGSGFTNLTSADAINDVGQIAGSGLLADGSYHAYLLTPTGPLVVAITNPPAHTTLVAPATFPVSAYVSDTAGTVTNVQFLVNGTVISNVTAAPYCATVANLGPGAYSLSAVATDDAGQSTAAGMSVIVEAPITLFNPACGSTGFSFSFQTRTGLTYEVQLNSLLLLSNQWLTFASLAGDGSVVRMTNSPLTNDQCVYRVIAH